MTEPMPLGRRAWTALAALVPFAAAAQAQTPPQTRPGGPRDPSRPLLLQGAGIVTLDTNVPDLARGDIRIVNGRIEAIAPRLEPGDADVLDARGRIAIPGLVNAHIHLAQSLNRGMSADHTILGYFRDMVARYSPRLSPDDLYVADLAGALEQIECGTTALFDWSREAVSPDHADAALAALEASGIRALFAWGVPAPGAKGDLAARQAWAAHAARLRAGAHASEDRLVVLGASIRGPDAGPLEEAEAELALIRELGLRVSTHVGAPIYGLRKRGSVAALARAGLLGPRTNLVHANDLDEEEYARIAELGVSISSTPEVELSMGHGLPPTRIARERGIAQGLGTDIPSMVGGGLLPQLRIALAAERAAVNARTLAAGGRVERLALTARDALGMATLGGARTMGIDRIAGSLTPGKRADLVLLRVDGFATQPVWDPVATATLQAGPGSVDAVLVDGVVLKEDGRLTHPDAARIRARMIEVAARLYRATEGRDPPASLL